MGFFKSLFQKFKKDEDFEENWEEIVYARDEVNFRDDEQRKRYIESCLEQMAEAGREINQLEGEYALVTSYLTDMEEIEALPESEREEINTFARKLSGYESEIQNYKEKKNRMPESRYNKLKQRENEIEEGIRKLKENEEYATLVKKDLRKLDGERHAYIYRKNELKELLNNYKGMAVIFLTALVLCVIMLAILQFGFEMEVFIGYFLSIGAGAIAITVMSVKYMDADRELIHIEKAINKIIQLQNKVKIRYVNNRNLLDYLCIKYDTKNSKQLSREWEAYKQEKEERRQHAEAEAKVDFYAKELVDKLSKFRIKDPHRWIHQTQALLDPREMVEIRHDLILRRQALRKQMDYNEEVAGTAKNEIMDIAKKYPSYAGEIMNMVEMYEKREHF
ncbi:MAG: hypothetical protein IJ608_07325 [Lachnospiraceae bacterium]|nr:hypothetical protein [Lachnospiraceae bacterium]